MMRSEDGVKLMKFEWFNELFLELQLTMYLVTVIPEATQLSSSLTT